MHIQLGETSVELRPDGTAYLTDHELLLVADLHLGKDASLRAASIPMPDGGDEATLARLSLAVGQTRPRMLLILGDLWHHSRGTTETVARRLENWIATCGVRTAMIEGNHDVRSHPLIAVNGLENLGPEFTVGSISMVHDPDHVQQGPAICGHLHPGVRLEGRGRQAIAMRAFWRRGDVLVLPAYGELTGHKPLEMRPDDDVFAIADGRVFPVPPFPASREQRAARRS